MNIKYKIVEVWPDDHLIVVRYYTDLITEENLRIDENSKDDGTPYRCRTDVSIDVPIPEPDDTEMEKLILRNAPKAFLEKLEAVKNPKINTKMNKTKKLLGREKVISETEYEIIVKTEDTNISPLSDDEIKALLDQIK